MRRRPRSTGRAGPRSCTGARTSAATTGPSRRSGTAAAARVARCPSHALVHLSIALDDDERAGRRRRRRRATAGPCSSCGAATARCCGTRTSPRTRPPSWTRPAASWPTCASPARSAARARARPDPADRHAPRPAPTVRRRAAHRRRAGPARLARPGTRPRRRSCCCATSAARWSRTPGRSSASPTPPSSVAGRVEAFALGTRLTRITRELSSHDPTPPSPGRPQPSPTGRAAPGWARGSAPSTTRGAVRGMARGAIVVILSDGWDRGDPEVLAEQMARLQPGRPPGGLGQPAQGLARLRAAGPGHGRGAARTSTSSWKATRWPRSRRSRR